MRPFLNLVSYARHGPGRRDHFSRAELEIIAQTVHRAPEVMVKVLTRGGQNLAAAARHLDYLDREGELVTDDGQELMRKGVGKDLLLDWDLDLEEDRPTMALEARPKRRRPSWSIKCSSPCRPVHRQRRCLLR